MVVVVIGAKVVVEVVVGAKVVVVVTIRSLHWTIENDPQLRSIILNI